MRAFLFTAMAGSMLPASLLAGCTMDSASGDGQPETGVPVAQTCPAETRGWTAWVNAMPGPDAKPTLIVSGEAFVPAGAKATLTAGPTDRMMPPSQRFVLALESMPEAEGGWQQVRVEVTPAMPQYRSLMIGCGGEGIATITDIETAV